MERYRDRAHMALFCGDSYSRDNRQPVITRQHGHHTEQGRMLHFGKSWVSRVERVPRATQLAVPLEWLHYASLVIFDDPISRTERTSLKNRLRRISVLAGAILIAATGMVATASTASAGTNGQQVQICNGRGDVHSVVLVGTNEKGQHPTITPHHGINFYKCTTWNNWWWKYDLQVNLYSDIYGHGYIGERHTNVPVSMNGNTFTYWIF